MLILNGRGHLFCITAMSCYLVPCINATSKGTYFYYSHWSTILPFIQHAHELAVIRTGRPLPEDHFSDWVVFSSVFLPSNFTKNPFAQQVPSSLFPQRDRPWLTAPLSHSRVKTCARRTSDWGNYPCWDIRGHVSRSQWGTGRQQMQNKSHRNYTFQLSIERYCSSIMLGEKGWKTSPQRPSMPRSKENKWGAP